MISTGNEVQIAFITGPNKKGNTDFLLNHLSYGKSKVSIASTEIIKAVILNEKGMYLQSVIAMYAIQIGLQKKTMELFLFTETFNEKIHWVDLIIFFKQVIDRIYINVVCTFKKVLIKTDLFYEILQQLMQAHLQFPANSLESFDERGI